MRSEFDQSAAAIANGRDAIDRFNAALISVARGAWADRWTELTPSPVVLSTWVGYDTDGRTDIGWWDTLRLRLEMKRLQLARLHAQVSVLPSAEALAERVAEARDAVDRQIELCPDQPEPAKVAAFAHALVGGRETALTSPAPLLPLFRAAIAKAEDHEKLALTVARAGLVSHGMALAHTHTRLNAAQIHNVVRQRLGIADPPEDPSHRRALFAAINAALDTVKPEPVDFGALISEQASAAKLMMTVAQIVKHIDGSVPVRFLIAETETGYTLLAALWLARLFGIEQHVEISPLFETAEALEQGADGAGGGAAQPALPRLPEEDRQAGAAVRLLRFRPLCRAARRQLPDRAAAAEDRRRRWSTTASPASRSSCSTPMARASAAARIPGRWPTG